MDFFRKKSGSASDDYYNLYKAELGRKEDREEFFSLKTLFKVETITILAGVVFIGYSSFFSDFSKSFSIEFNYNLLVSKLFD